MVLGLILVIVGGWMLGNYITRPINMLEEGLLAILNGQQDKRFELDHPELGGLAFRIDQLLNQLMGVEEDTTDEEGRPSKAPSAADFREAMAVDRGTGRAVGDGQQVDPAQAQAPRGRARRRSTTRASTASTSAPRRRSASRPTTSPSRRSRRASRAWSATRPQKYGRPVRYQVHARNKEVVLLAVPLPG